MVDIDREKLTSIIRTIFKKRRIRTDYEISLLGFPLARCSKQFTKQTCNKLCKPATLEKIFSSIGIDITGDDTFTDSEIELAENYAVKIIREVYPLDIPPDAFQLFDTEIEMCFGKVIKKFEPPKPLPKTAILIDDAYKTFPDWDWKQFYDWATAIKLQCYKRKDTDQYFFGYDDFCTAANDWFFVHNDELNADSSVALSTYENHKKLFQTFLPSVQIVIDDDNFVFTVVNPIDEFKHVLRIADYSRSLIQ